MNAERQNTEHKSFTKPDETRAFAHGRAVLHCDLKPANILFDSQHEPHIADFGLARTIEASGSFGEAWGGTRGWMSPEQVDKGSIDNKSDVFTLGVFLYWLLCGTLPFGQGDDFDELVRQGQPKPIPPQRRWDSALVVTYAEFGRRSQENGSNGTDHGTANAHFALGGRVKGGLYGEAPRLDRLESGNLAYAVDFRSVYATVLERWWGVPSAGPLGPAIELRPVVHTTFPSAACGPK